MITSEEFERMSRLDYLRRANGPIAVAARYDRRI
jgi:hypothetical protein